MNFDDTPAEAEFRATVRAWIAANAPHHLAEGMRKAFGSGRNGVTGEDPLVASRAWQKRKAEAGYACPTWPKQYGGGGMTPMERVIWQQEEGIFAQLSGVFAIGHGMCGPTLMAYASEEQKARFLPPMVAGDEIWCQLFSEPAAGSDVAALRTRAVPADDGTGDWIVNGQKIWTSGAQLSDFGIMLARTDPTVPKHKGLSMFFLDMRSPGVDIRPIKQANGQSGFNEVFFTDVRIPAAQILGAPGQGWSVSLTTLMNERQSIGSTLGTAFEEIFAWLRTADGPEGPMLENRAVRLQVARWAARSSGLKYTTMRTISAISRGETPGPENSIGKLVIAGLRHEMASFALDLQGAAGIVADPALASADGMFQAIVLRSPASRLEGGTDEILRNIIAERVLGLPGDIRVDKDIPFDRLPAA